MVNVKIKQGWLCGEKLDTITGEMQYCSFKGIPYAVPPTGKLRFKAPKPPLSWAGIREGKEHGPKCPQLDVFTGEVQPGSEDCLHLNVYTPDLTPTYAMPVMVFIHGGFDSGSGNCKNYGPDFFMKHGVVFVTINYRLGPLGFLCLDTEEAPGNAGLKDQVAALRWIKDNIAQFGGNSDNVTIIGHSSGGVCAALHILSPLSKGLFKRVISMSAIPFSDWTTCDVQKQALLLGKQLGLDTHDPNILLKYLQDVSVEKIIRIKPSDLYSKELTNDKYVMHNFTPVAEKEFGQEYFLIENPKDMLKNGKINDVDVFIGHTSEESLVEISIYEESFKKLIHSYSQHPETLVPKYIQMKFTPTKIMDLTNKIQEFYFKSKPISEDHLSFIRYYSHVKFVINILKFASKLPKMKNGRRYMYRFSCSSSRNVYGIPGTKYGIKGTSHLDDLMYLMHAKRYNLKLEKNTKEYALVQLVCTVFTNFAKYGNPTPDSSLGISWPEYDNVTKSYVDIGDTLTPGSNSLGEAYEFWRSIDEEVGLEY